MTTLLCRLLPYAVAEGAWNMAADEALLESAVAGVASLRFYGWTEATLSLGYFQPAAGRHDDPLLATLPFVRRPTGGAALVHDRELTYALALPVGAAGRSPGTDWPARIHGWLAAALADLGVHAEPCRAEQGRGAFLCFLHQTPGDLLVGGAKVAGSAQRKRRGALLQHGSLLLAASPFTPSLPGVAELTGRRLAPPDVATATVATVRRAGWRVEPGDWTAAERRRAAELAGDRYGSAAWNEKR